MPAERFCKLSISSRPKDRKPAAEDFKRMGRVLNEMENAPPMRASLWFITTI